LSKDKNYSKTNRIIVFNYLEDISITIVANERVFLDNITQEPKKPSIPMIRMKNLHAPCSGSTKEIMRIH